MQLFIHLLLEHDMMHAIRHQSCSIPTSQLPAKCILAGSTGQHSAVSMLQPSTIKECTWEVGCAAESRVGLRIGAKRGVTLLDSNYMLRAMQPTLEVVVEMGMPAAMH